MKPKYPYALYLDSKILGTATQLLSFFEQEIFSRDNTIIYLKRYKESATAFQKIFERARIPYQFMRPSELDQLSDQIIFYAFNAQSNCRLVANRKLKHIFITHGESNKVSSIKPILRIYDHVIMAGKLSLERYYKSGLFDEHDYTAGRLILMGDTFIGRTGFNPNTGKESVLFYAPTWEGGLESENYSSLQNINVVSKAILECAKTLNFYKVLIKPHPNTGHRSSLYKKRLVSLICKLSQSGIQVLLYSNNLSFSWIDKIRFQKNGVSLLSSLRKYRAEYAFVDISAMESQCLNESIDYSIFYRRSTLRQDIPRVFFDHYLSEGIEIDAQNTPFLFKANVKFSPTDFCGLFSYSNPHWEFLSKNERIPALVASLKANY